MSANEYGQGKSHATGDSAVPGKVQEVAPKGLEEALPDKVHSHCSILHMRSIAVRDNEDNGHIR
jgi:hypothetical protein